MSFKASVELHRRTVSGSEFQTGDRECTSSNVSSGSCFYLSMCRPMYNYLYLSSILCCNSRNKHVMLCYVGTVNRGAWDDRRCLAGVTTLVRSLRCAGVDIARTLWLYAGL